MKGQSEVVAIILIVMIVVALAALAWTWFSGMFSQITQTAESSVLQTAQQMAQNFVLENAFCDVLPDPDEIQFTIRNVGNSIISNVEITAYIDDKMVDPLELSSSGSDLGKGDIETFTISSASFDCPTSKILKITIASGLSKTRTIL